MSDGRAMVRAQALSMFDVCSRCGGSGRVEVQRAYGPARIPCPECAARDAELGVEPSRDYRTAGSEQPEHRSIQARFLRFHAENLHVYEELVRRARLLKNQGWEGIGISLIYEAMRYDAMLRTSATDGEPYKLSNDFRSRYSRLIMDNERDLAGFFRIRELREEG